MNEYEEIDWDKVPEERVKEIIREAELLLSDQLSASYARDQRAMGLLGALVTIALASLGAGGSFVLADQPNLPLAIAFSAVAIVSYLGSWQAMKVFESKKFNFSGNRPKGWFRKEDMFGSWPKALAGQAHHYQEMIDENELLADKAGKRQNTAIKFAIAVPATFFVVWVLALELV